MIQINRHGVHWNQNLIDPTLEFETTQVWNVTSGTGSCITSPDVAFEGDNSLKMTNTNPAAKLVATYTKQNVEIQRAGNYGFGCYLLKTQATEIITGKVNIFQNASLLSAQSFSIGSATAADDVNDEWVRYAMDDTVLALLKGDDITFTVEMDLSATAAGSLLIYFDGFHLYPKDRGDIVAPKYTRPVSDTIYKANAVSGAVTAKANDVVLADATSGAFTVTLEPVAISVNTVVTVKKTDVSVNVVTVDADGAELIDGVANKTLTSQYDYIVLFCDGSTWHVIG